jgi:SpoVK/Ycf46/Vps4 family AAA+-type ATPase
MSRSELEAALLSDPFNVGLRLAYANLLLNADEPAAARAQFQLASKGAPSAAAMVGEARAWLAEGDRLRAIECYQRARALPDFVTDPALDELAASARPVLAPRLSVVASDGSFVPVEPQRSRLSFADVAGMDELKQSLRLAIIEPFLKPGLFARFRKSAGGGVLLYGPPGCGKTLMARAVAGECRAEFISVGVSEIVSMWMGDSEQRLANLFEKARAMKPAVLFFDELDALAFSRSKASSEHSRRIVNEFLSQLDGFGNDNREVLIMAATNMPWDVDSAMKRPGRFARQVFVAPPDALARQRILELKLDGVPTQNLNLNALAKSMELYSGADIDGLIDLAKESVLAEIINGGDERPLSQSDLQSALTRMQASTVDWLSVARNLVRYGGSDTSYRELEKYLKTTKFG